MKSLKCFAQVNGGLEWTTSALCRRIETLARLRRIFTRSKANRERMRFLKTSSSDDGSAAPVLRNFCVVLSVLAVLDAPCSVAMGTLGPFMIISTATRCDGVKRSAAEKAGDVNFPLVDGETRMRYRNKTTPVVHDRSSQDVKLGEVEPELHRCRNSTRAVSLSGSWSS